MILFKVHYFDHVINRGRIQDVYAWDMEHAIAKWTVMRLATQETLSINQYRSF